MKLTYTLTVYTPDRIDGDVWTEILEDASAHDATDEAKVGRWLGGHITSVEHDLYDALPEGWTASISDS